MAIVDTEFQRTAYVRRWGAVAWFALLTIPFGVLINHGPNYALITGRRHSSTGAPSDWNLRPDSSREIRQRVVHFSDLPSRLRAEWLVWAVCRRLSYCRLEGSQRVAHKNAQRYILIYQIFVSYCMIRSPGTRCVIYLYHLFSTI